MLDAAQRQPPGAYLRLLVEQHCGGREGERRDCGRTPAPIAKAPDEAYQSAFTREAWEDLITRENAIRFRFHPASARGGGRGGWAGVGNPTDPGVGENMEEADRQAELFKSQMERALSGAGLFYHLAEPAAEVDAADSLPADNPLDSPETGRASNGRDIAATKCIVRIRNSQRQKHTAILSTAKSVNYFKLNFMQVLRKELTNLNLPRGPVESSGTGTSAVPLAEAKNRAQPHASTGSKKRKKKR
ncbi:unnamed protein product [Phytomonas sp. Hart1]|nr:unnamed protein product [Phytomonas sp. Hart1]|eukprot:CCW72346.1 unnamed protein product [Phytomonas sp. isolate Hart1]